jgi:hypothetical protein
MEDLLKNRKRNPKLSPTIDNALQIVAALALKQIPNHHD